MLLHVRKVKDEVSDVSIRMVSYSPHLGFSNVIKQILVQLSISV